MAAPKITAIVDKDVGQVFGAVLERNATDKLPVASVTGDFPIRAAAASGSPPLVPTVLEIPSAELDSIAVVNTAVLQAPKSFVVVNGAVATGIAPTWKSLIASDATNPAQIHFTTPLTGSSILAKAVFYDQTTKQTGVIPAQKIDKGMTVDNDWKLPAPGLENSHKYDVLLLVEKHGYLLQTDQQPS